jgi:DNA-binding MarR family transcriptional regulator
MGKAATATAPRVAKPGSETRELARGLAALIYGTAAAGEFMRAVEESGLTLTQCKVLTALSAEAEEPRAARDVAAITGASLPTVSRAVDVLVRNGLVTRDEDEEDRRVRQLTLTANGRRLVGELVAHRVEGLAGFIAGLNSAQRRKLGAALDALLEHEQIATAYRQLREERS